jgi:phage shock protein C
VDAAGVVSAASAGPGGGRHGERRRAMDGNRKLYRSRTNRMLGGVCGGLAQYLNIDVTVIRVAFVVLSVLGGSGVLIYIAMWVLVPPEL